MTEQVIASPQECVVTSSDKWGKTSWPNQPNSKVAHRILDARLQAVWRCLPLAAEKSEEDVEHVHQLRIATRRAVEALRVFSDLIPDAECQEMRARLRKIRLAADEARNWDVLADLFMHSPDVSGGGIVSRIVEEIKSRRREVQQPIVAIHQELVAEKFDERIETLLKAVRSQRQGKGKRKFGREARRHLRAVLRRFFKASDADVSDDDALHNLRIRTKKLRYTMEMLAVAFEPAFRKKLYPQISKLQDIMGIVNDHAMGKAFFHDWWQKAQDAQEKAFLEGLVFAEARARRDVQQAFLAMWTPKTAAELRRQFRMYCRLP
jgi:CHAD domain-containing protein